METGILIVEDELIVAKHIERTLRAMGYPVVGRASSGEDAVQKALELRPALVLMDINLGGGIDGIEAARRIQAGLDVPVVFLTAYSDMETLQRAKAASPFGYIVKPFKEGELRAAAELATHQHRLLGERERVLTHSLESMADAVVTSGARIVYLNPLAETLTGWSLAEAKGRDAGEVLDLESDREPGRKVANPALVALRVGVRVELDEEAVLVRRDGARVPVEATAAPILDRDDALIGSVVVMRDVTQRRRTEEHIRHINRELEAANRELESFGYSIAHDLRGPIRAIEGFAGVLERQAADRLDDVERGYLQRIRAGARRMAQLTDDLLRLSQINRTDLEPQATDVSAMCLEILDTLREAEPDREVELLVEPGMRAVADPRLLRVLLDNLLSNSWKFTRDLRPGRIEVRQGEDGSFRVADNGVGFDMEFADKLFQPFQRLHGTTEFAGTGIGLTIVRRIVERHGGWIRVDAEPGQGATFTFGLGPTGPAHP